MTVHERDVRPHVMSKEESRFAVRNLMRIKRIGGISVIRVGVAVLAVLAISWMIYWGHLRGALAALTALATFVCYYRFSMREFGGINGDLAGHFLQSCERNVVLVLAAMRLAGTCLRFLNF